MTSRARWEAEGRNWPNRDASWFVEAAGLRWHVQLMGQGPAILLLHGTGAATHSWRDILPRLASDFTVIAPDLPGHGFTEGRPRGGLTLPGIAAAVADLLASLDATPALIVGHSAGAAIAIAMVRDGYAGTPVMGFNPALMPFPGLAAKLFPTMARMLFLNPFVPRMLAGIARMPGETGRFLRRSTGSTINAAGVACYESLLGTRAQCEGAMEMMASWDLDTLSKALPGVTQPVRLVHGAGDLAVPLSSVERAARLLPHARLDVLPRLGHLAHEEQPETAAQLVRDFATALSGETP